MAAEPEPPAAGSPDEPDAALDTLLGEIEAAVEPVTESVTMSPAVGIAVSGGPMITLPAGEGGPTADAPSDAHESVRTGLTKAGPVAVAGLVVNGVAALLVVATARRVSSRSYGEIAQLLGLFFIVSMPGSAVLVGVVRRVTALETTGHGAAVRAWMRRAYRATLAGLAVGTVVVVLSRGWIARQLSLTDSRGVALVLVAGGIWILLSVDRGLLQAHRRYAPLAVNLCVEGGARTVLILVFVLAHLGVAGYALGVFIGELIAALHAHWLNAGDRRPRRLTAAGAAASDASPLVRRRLVADVGAAFCGLAMLGFLQNVDVIVLGRLDHANVGPYAAISVASKALVFGAVALGAYLLPEATIRWNEGGHAVRQFGVTLIFLAVPAVVLLVVSVVAPRRFLTLVFGARLSQGAPAFATLVAAMICLSVSVLVTNYLFGTGSRWIVLVLMAGSGLAAGLVAAADGHIVATARADLEVQAALVATLLLAFVGVHVRHRGERWFPGRTTADGRRGARPGSPDTLGVRLRQATER